MNWVNSLIDYAEDKSKLYDFRIWGSLFQEEKPLSDDC